MEMSKEDGNDAFSLKIPTVTTLFKPEWEPRVVQYLH